MLVPTAPQSANPIFGGPARPRGFDNRPVSLGAFTGDWEERGRQNLALEHDDDDDLYNDDADSDFYGEPAMWSSVRDVDWWVRKPTKKKRVGDTARRVFSLCSICGLG